MTAQVQPTTDVSAVLALTEHRVQLSPLRRRLAEFPGQPRVRDQLGLVLAAVLFR